MNRRNHISTARELALELRSAHSRFNVTDVGNLPAEALWDALQPDPELARRFRDFIDSLYFDGIRSRFFGEFDPAKLILPIADDIASRLEMLAADLEAHAPADPAAESKRCRDSSTLVETRKP